NDQLDGKTITALSLSRVGLDIGTIAFTATFSDSSQGVYSMPLVTDVRITAQERLGNDLRLSFTTLLGRNYAVQSSTDLSSNAWTTLPGTNAGNGATVQVTVT